MKNILINGGYATGKTITARAISYYIGKKGQEISDAKNNNYWSDIEEIEEYNQSDKVEYIQVHSSLSYEDIVYGLDIKANGNIILNYAEKRIKKICDKANGNNEPYFIILDDICRTNPGKLLGNLLYAMEYRKQPVILTDGNILVIPENVYFIITENPIAGGETLEYAIRRRFNYVIDLDSNKLVLEKYYSGLLSSIVKPIVLDIFERIENFIASHSYKENSVSWKNYVPGHGMYMVDKKGSVQDVLFRIKEKIEYQLFPLINELRISGVIATSKEEIKEEQSIILSKINVGQSQNENLIRVNKIYIDNNDEKKKVKNFTLLDTKKYCKNTILKGGSNNYKEIIENVVDAILLNGIIPPDAALSHIFLNTNYIKIQNRNNTNEYASFMVLDSLYGKQGKTRDIEKWCNYRWYKTEDKKYRQLYNSKGNVYEFVLPNEIIKTYYLISGIRPASTKTHWENNYGDKSAIPRYTVLFLLVKAYLDTYEKELSLRIISNAQLQNLYDYIKIEKKYWIKISEKKGDEKTKFLNLIEACMNLQTMWNNEGSEIIIDKNKFEDLVYNKTEFSIEKYEDLSKNINKPQIIKLEGVKTMVDLNDYQQIMDNINVKQMIFQGPPGTSKTYESKRFILKQLNSNAGSLKKNNPTQEEISKDLEGYRLTTEDYMNPEKSSKLTTGGWDFVQFHPSYAYEDFIRGIDVKPTDNGNPVYESINRILGKIAEFAKLSEKLAKEEGNIPNFYLIIDEINRANLASVFGELIYGLEYRDSPVSTPYEVNNKYDGKISKDIVIGNNLYIIGTMNTADKSIDAIDYAIRRRFLFIDSPASRDVVISCYQNKMGVKDKNSIELLLFDAVGEIFDEYFNDEYQKSDVRIGHTYFLRKSKDKACNEMIEKFLFQVIPILKEYVKDGIIETSKDVKQLHHSINEIVNASEEIKVSLLSDMIMLFVKYYGENDIEKKEINNKYIAEYIEELCKELQY